MPRKPLPQGHVRTGKRKFYDGQIVRRIRDGQLMVVVGYDSNSHEYLLVRMMKEAHRQPFGPQARHKSFLLEAAPDDVVFWGKAENKKVIQTYGLNRRLGHTRDCRCNCCPHMRLTATDVNAIMAGEEERKYLRAVAAKRRFDAARKGEHADR